jgi:hypothetical protein
MQNVFCARLSAAMGEKMPSNTRHNQFLLLLGMLALSGLTAYAYRTSAQWRRPSAAPAGQPSALSPPLRGRAVSAVVTLTSAAASTHAEAGEGAAVEPAQSGGNYNITQSVIPGGGGTSANGNTNVIGSAGQSVAAASSGGSYTLSGGFWGGQTSGGCPAITVNPSNPALTPGAMGVAYSQPFTQSGGNGTLTWSNPGGGLPGGLTLNTGTGVLSGTPTAQGTFNFTIRATDANNCMGERAYTLFINGMPCPTITVSPSTPTLTAGTMGAAYSQTFTQTGGNGAITWSTSAGSLPNGLTLNAGTGILSGTPTIAAASNFSVRATDANSCFGERTYTLTINPASNGLQFFALAAPVRLLDTRPGASPNACSQPNAPIAGQTSRTQPGRNICTIPANAMALTGNVTTVQSGGGFLTLYPSDAQQPTVASTNYGDNEIINNMFTVGLGADGAFKIFAQNTTDVVVDVTGYYAPPTTGGLFFHLLPAPVRLLETRAGFSGCVIPGVPLTGNADSTQQAISACTGIPAAARAIVGNATTVNPQGGGFLTIFPGDVVRPLVAASNFNTGQIVNGPFAVGLAADGQFKIYTTSTTDLVVDVLGYYSPEAHDANGAGLLFYPLAHPVRLLETRPGFPVGCFKPGVPLTGGAETAQGARGVCDGLTIPANALGVVGNATVVFPSGPGFLTLWPSPVARPLVATANYNTGDIGNRHFVVGLGNADGAFKIYTQATSHLVVDLSGYFAP